MSAEPLRVAVIGAPGRMGRFALGLLASHAAFDPQLALGSEDDGELEAALEQFEIQVALDVTRAGLGAEHARRMLAVGVRPVIGTSGVTQEEVAELDAEARRRGLGGLVVPNFSLGMLLLQRFAVEAARAFPSVEILELHHEQKLDAPSGTARDTARRLAPLVGEVPIHSVRLPGLFAHQEVLLGAAGELLTLRHDMLGPSAFGPGLLLALRHAATAVGVAWGLDAALASAGPEPQNP